MAEQQPERTVLHVGCGPFHPAALHSHFQTDGWKEIRVDIDPAAKPDIVASMTDLSMVDDNSVDGVWSSHNIEHLFAHEVPIALAEFRRVLKPGGLLLMTLPDVQEVARHVAEGRLEEVLYTSPAGPISAIDILFGYRPAIAGGNRHMAHKTGFTAGTLEKRLSEAGFVKRKVDADRPAFALWASAHKPPNAAPSPSSRQ